ncbi:unnamed protein product [Trifolium pratense]|uniref:Uncharacterized protein n=1 Tax=Trifolium pratense TaxID=57577 RepID=A0ACB0JJD7_TRIPR|nr:unnamed protein product [Trifolium pratense]
MSFYDFTIIIRSMTVSSLFQYQIIGEVHNLIMSTLSPRKQRTNLKMPHDGFDSKSQYGHRYATISLSGNK